MLEERCITREGDERKFAEERNTGFINPPKEGRAMPDSRHTYPFLSVFQIEWRIPIIRRKTCWHSRSIWTTSEHVSLPRSSNFPHSFSLSRFEFLLQRNESIYSRLPNSTIYFPSSSFFFLFSSVNDPSLLFHRPLLPYSGKSVKGDGWKNKRGEGGGRELRELKMTFGVRRRNGVTGEDFRSALRVLEEGKEVHDVRTYEE